MNGWTRRRCSRREALRTLAAAGMAAMVGHGRALAAEPKPGLIASIMPETVFPGREADTFGWFHPRGCVIPTATGRTAFMTLQTIGGSDYFGPVHSTTSTDDGRTWSTPQPIPGFGRRPADDGMEEGVCDVVPEYHPQTNTVLALGHNVFYAKGRLVRPQPARWPVYMVRAADGNWGPLRRLEWDDPRGAYIYTSNCSQRITLPDGDLLVPLTFGATAKAARSVAVLRCGYDGETVAVKSVSNALFNPVKRGLLEPSLAVLDGRYYLTIRAEDDRGYVSVSDDGSKWSDARPWQFDDGEELVMSTTQQHWLPHSDGLFLVYTRRTDTNRNVVRWRAPLFIAEVDRKTMRLRRDTEQVVLPLRGDGVNAPKQVALMGNFHPWHLSPSESVVTVGENFGANGFRGDTLLARIRWGKPNRLVE